VSRLADFIASSEKLLVITGAGCSTESGVPDYRSPNGAYTKGHKPMTHQQFMSGEPARRRYWARSFVGWRRFSGVQPNAAHFTLARMQAAGRLAGGLITQNVDRLHQQAGSTPVLELHGTTHRVVCLSCGADTCRVHMQERLAALNPNFVDDDGKADLQQRPDGDVELAQQATLHFNVPHCESCHTGILKPDVVFFGANVPAHVAHTAKHWAETADALLVVGSSMSTWSSFRLANEVARRGRPIAIVNIGHTRSDAQATLKIQARASEVLARALVHGGLDLPALSTTVA
jgi:NAD-dependent deacetylase sirtuin 4